MIVHGITPILNVSSIRASLEWFEGLGWRRCWTYNDSGMIEGARDENEAGPANFAAVGSGAVEIFLCRDGQGSRGQMPREPGDEQTGGVWLSWWVGSPAEVDAAHARAEERGYVINWPPTDEPWGVRECRIVHPDGHTFRVSAAIRR